MMIELGRESTIIPAYAGVISLQKTSISEY